MKIIILHNKYAVPGRGSGEEVMINAITELLRSRGHEVVPCLRSSSDVLNSKFGKPKAFFSGIYNFRARSEMKKMLAREMPDFIFVQNVFPLFSPSVLSVFREAGIPVIMRCPNYRLVCPNGLLMSKGEVCEKCTGGREYRCVLKNCEGNIFKSTGYALRNFAARRLSLFKENVDVFMVLTEFAKKLLIQNGYPSEKIFVLSGLADPGQSDSESDLSDGDYVGFAGRVSPEKGVDVLIEVAKRLPELSFKVAGKYDRDSEMVRQAPQNFEFLGQLNRQDLKKFYADSKMLVVPSRWYEGLPVVMIEAMLGGKPVICSDMGGLSEVVENGVTGLVCRPDDVDDFTEKIQTLWGNKELCRKFGIAGRKKAMDIYHPDAFYQRLMAAYEIALQNKNRVRQGGGGRPPRADRKIGSL